MPASAFVPLVIRRFLNGVHARNAHWLRDCQNQIFLQYAVNVRKTFPAFAAERENTGLGRSQTSGQFATAVQLTFVHIKPCWNVTQVCLSPTRQQAKSHPRCLAEPAKAAGVIVKSRFLPTAGAFALFVLETVLFHALRATAKCLPGGEMCVKRVTGVTHFSSDSHWMRPAYQACNSSCFFVRSALGCWIGSKHKRLRFLYIATFHSSMKWKSGGKKFLPTRN